jgi:hypothetical protein
MRDLVFGLRLQADVSELFRQAVPGIYGATVATIGQRGNVAGGRIAAGSEINRAKIETQHGKLSQFQDDPCQNCTFMEVGWSSA